MDQSHDEMEIPIRKYSNKYYLFIKKTIFNFLVPVSLASFLLSHASGFSFFFTYINFHFISALVFPLFARILERKYMFLICNGILAFLVKTLNFNSSHSLSFPDHDNSIKADTDEDNYANMASESPQKTAIIAEEEDRVEMQEKGNQELKGRQPAAGGLIFSNEDLLDMIEEEEEEVEEGGGNGGLLGGASAAQEEEESVNINTEELNKKIEEFIRKMKEEIRIQAHQINNPNL